MAGVGEGIPGASPLGVRMDDVAARAQVSRATVSRVLMGTVPVSEKTRAKVHAALRELGYVPNMIAQGLAGGRSDLVGLLLRGPSNPAYGLLHSEIQIQAVRLGLQLITVVPAPMEPSEAEFAALRRLLGLRVGGLMVSTGVIRSTDLEPFLDTVPVVSVGRIEEHPGIYGVSYDEDTNAAIVADRVATAGHRAAAVVITGSELSTAEHRRGLGMAAHLEGRGVDVHRLEASTFGTHTDCYDDVVALSREGRATAALFPSDIRALGFLDHADAAGVRVPEDLSVTGFDAIMPGLNRIGLASLRIPVARVAERGAEVMKEMLRDRESVPVRHERFPGEFVPGRTLAAPR
ncbi:LacI family DNA-binding transcriptional regulator [Arthrobacter sp. M4]|uniref:LacI family DNA-binding transcriptional regulator n=1 Tax=Arthrobacter sp. M4 TaxID=218160 RepID=UPI001CDD2F05|nr:LacI family DNA-binding transcriptional regulator [Arthrobacter sp. M4]MCA4133452.1 LacI family transcriptional regulator [Arthrobacter sp. M4]